MPEFVQCALCKRVVREEHTNSTGRCVYCAGKPEEVVRAELQGDTADNAVIPYDGGGKDKDKDRGGPR